MERHEYHDPDYPSQEPSTSQSKLDKAREIIDQQFNEELTYKEQEIKDIDTRLWSTRRTLHELRKTIVEQYYARGTHLTETDIQHELENHDSKTKASVSAILRNEQKAIHPTVRKFLGIREVQPEEMFRPDFRPTRRRQPKNYSAMLNPSLSGTEEKTVKEQQPKAEPANKLAENVKRQLVEESNKPKKQPREDPQPRREAVTLEQGARGRKKHKYRIIVGNTSKYAPSSSKLDRSTHKWLLYIRGDQNCPDLSVIVTSCTVHLHESYAPHHVVYIDKPPFHISRRGWGEFPATIQLNFTLHKLNRPATLSHTIKLDRKCTGLQTLGSETLVDVWLYSNEEMLKYEYKDPEIPPIPVTSKDDQNWTDLFNTEGTELDVDELIIQPVKNNKELNNEGNKLKKLNNEQNEVKSEQNVNICDVSKNGEKDVINDDSESVYHNVEIKEEPLDMDELESGECDNFIHDNPYSIKIEYDDSIETNVQNNAKHKEFENNVINGVNKNLCLVKNNINMDHCYFGPPPESDIPQDSRPIEGIMPNDTVKILIDVPKNCAKSKINLAGALSKISCCRNAVSFLLRNIPVISEDPNLREMFPFIMESEEMFWGLDVSKRKNIEWSRAETIHQLLTQHFRDKQSIWQTKHILKFSQMHSFNPIKNVDMELFTDFDTQKLLHSNFKSKYPTPAAIDSGSVFDESHYLKQTIDKFKLSDEVELACDSDDEVDVMCIDSDDKVKKLSPVKSADLEVLPVDDEDERLGCLFIERKCMDIGIELRNEDVGGGYSHCSVHRVILQAVRSLVSDIVRGAICESRMETRLAGNGEHPPLTSIGLQHILGALQRDRRLHFLTAADLSSERMQYLGAL